MPAVAPPNARSVGVSQAEDARDRCAVPRGFGGRVTGLRRYGQGKRLARAEGAWRLPCQSRGVADWQKQKQDEAIASYASAHGMTVFTDVPLTQAGWKGWPDNTNKRLAAVAVGNPGVAAGSVQVFNEQLLAAAMAEPHPVRPLIARGYADRTVFGWLVTRQAFLTRSWRPRGDVIPVALTGRSGQGLQCCPGVPGSWSRDVGCGEQ